MCFSCYSDSLPCSWRNIGKRHLRTLSHSSSSSVCPVAPSPSPYSFYESSYRSSAVSGRTTQCCCVKNASGDSGHSPFHVVSRVLVLRECARVRDVTLVRGCVNIARVAGHRFTQPFDLLKGAKQTTNVTITVTFYRNSR